MLPMEEPVHRASGNNDVIKLLESWLQRAKEHGQIGFVGLVASENLKHVVSDFAGCLELSFAANWGLDTLKYQLLVRTLGRHEEKFEPEIQECGDRICYDISSGPACYDFIVWLVLAEMNRVAKGAPAPLKVGFKMVDTPSEHAKHDKLRAAFYKNVIFPSLAFIGAVPDESANTAGSIERYTLKPVVELSRAGHRVPLLKAPEAETQWVQRYLEKDRRAPVTITLREVKGRWDHRNSNVTEWLKFAQYLEERGERVIFIRDTDCADEKIAGYQTCPAASKDVRIRLALYEAAKCNLFVSNGPFVLALFGLRPFLMFVETSPMSAFFPETPQWWMQWQGVHGDQFPWSSPAQQIVWKRDNFENLVEAWERLFPLLDSVIVSEAAE